jgi:hypothetical protein
MRMAGMPMVLRAVNPVPTPSSMRPGARRESVATAAAVAGAMRLVGTSTPVPRWMREVRSAASAIDTNTSAAIICVSANQAWLKPSASARWATFQESTAEMTPTPKSMASARPPRP